MFVLCATYCKHVDQCTVLVSYKVLNEHLNHRFNLIAYISRVSLSDVMHDAITAVRPWTAHKDRPNSKPCRGHSRIHCRFIRVKYKLKCYGRNYV